MQRFILEGGNFYALFAYRAGASIRADINIYIFIFLYRPNLPFFLAAGHLYRQPEPVPPEALLTGWRVELIAASAWG